MPWQSCLVYLDNILVHAKTFNQTITNFDQLFECLRQAGLKLSPNKCALFAKEVSYLGHVISRERDRTNPVRVRVVEEWPVPRNFKEVWGVLGRCSYYQLYVAKFVEISRPLHRLIEKRI